LGGHIISIADAKAVRKGQVPIALRHEQRTVVRYALEIPVTYRWIDRGLQRESVGRTRDVSVRAAYIVTGQCPPYGAKIEIQMNFAGARRRGVGWANAAGSVLRVDRLGQSGFVVESEGPRLFKR
jgi:hypothetical protein